MGFYLNKILIINTFDFNLLILVDSKIFT